MMYFRLDYSNADGTVSNRIKKKKVNSIKYYKIANKNQQFIKIVVKKRLPFRKLFKNNLNL